MTLSGSFGRFRRKLNLDEMPQEQALFAQGCYIAGAQACFQILAALSESDKSAAEVQIGWADLQQEIINAVPKAPKKEEDALPPERSLII